MSLGRLVTGEGRDEVSSPIGITRASVRRGRAGRGQLPLGARAHLALARAAEPAAAAAARRRPHPVHADRGRARALPAARDLRARLGGRPRASCCFSSSSGSRTTSASCRRRPSRRSDARRLPSSVASEVQIRVGDVLDRRRRARRRAVDDADEDARRRGDDGADRRARVGGLRDRARRRAEERGRGGAPAHRAPLADSRHRGHPLQRLARAEGDRGGCGRRADQPREHRRAGQGRAGRARGEEGRDPDAHRRELGLAAEAPARARAAGSGRGARRRRARGGRAAREARVPRLQDLGQGDARADDDPRVPDARRRRSRTRSTSA